MLISVFAQTAAALHSFFLAMALYPEVQAKARQEMDSVLGLGKLPTFDDFGTLPYIDAIVKELLRWYPIVPLRTYAPPSHVASVTLMSTSDSAQAEHRRCL